MKKEKYMIAVDLDGTIFYSLNDYDVKSTEILKELAKEHLVIIATGRPFRSSYFYHKLLGLSTPIINYNGALCHSVHDDNFSKSIETISKDDLIKFIEDNQDKLVNVFCEIEDDIYLTSENEKITPFLHSDGGILHIGELSKILPGNPHGAMVFIKKGYGEEIQQYIYKQFHGRLKLRIWYEDEFIYSELYDPKINKAQYLKIIAEYYSIDQDHIIAIGDGENDIEMLQYAKYGVAMGNSSEKVKNSAKYVTKSLSENGVYHFLNEFFKK